MLTDKQATVLVACLLSKQAKQAQVAELVDALL